VVVPLEILFKWTRWGPSGAMRFAGAPLVVEPSKCAPDKLGMGPTVTAPELLTTTGVSSPHSADPSVEKYPTSKDHVQPRVCLLIAIVQAPSAGEKMVLLMASPAPTVHA